MTGEPIQPKMLWCRYLPFSLCTRLGQRPKLLRALTNAGWLFGDRLLRMGVGLAVGVWVARHLGPTQFGTFNYVMALVALFGTVATVGLNGVVVRDLVKETEEEAQTTLGTAVLMRVVGGVLALGLSVFTIDTVRPEDSGAKFMVAILGLTFIFKTTEVVKYWFESQVQSKYTVLVENGAFLAVAAVKVVLIIRDAPLMAFVWATFVEGLLAAVGLLAMYSWRGGKLTAWRSRLQRTRRLLSDSWPLILSGFAAMVYMRIDQIMLGQMLGDGAVGIYSAAVRISEAWYFVPLALAASLFPSLIEAKKHGTALYNERLQRSYDLVVTIAVIVSLLVMMMAPVIIEWLYGSAYVEASAVLMIHTWGGLSVAVSAIHGKWLLIEGLQKLAFLYTAFGAIINVVLNMHLIEFFGISGAAYATLVAQVLPYGVLLVTTRTRGHLMVIAGSFNIFRIVRRCI